MEGLTNYGFILWVVEVQVGLAWRWAFLFTVMRLWMLQKAGKLLTSRGALVLCGLHVSLAVFRTRSPLLQHPIIKDVSQEKSRRATKSNTFLLLHTIWFTAA